MCFNNFHLLLNPTKLNTSFTQVVMQPFVTGAIMDNTGGSDKKQNKKSTLFTAFSHKNVEKKKKRSTINEQRFCIFSFPFFLNKGASFLRSLKTAADGQV